MSENDNKIDRIAKRTGYISAVVFGAVFFKMCEYTSDSFHAPEPNVCKEFKVLNKNPDNSINALFFNKEENSFEERQFYCYSGSMYNSLRLNHHYMGSFNHHRSPCDTYVLLGASPRPIQKMNMISAYAQERER